MIEIINLINLEIIILLFKIYDSIVGFWGFGEIGRVHV